MARYIDAEKLTNEIDEWLDSVGNVLIGKGMSYYGELLGCIEDTPTADVVEVKHGYWIENDYRSFDGFETVVYPNEALKCSECSHNFKKELLWRKNYCPECGAKMD